MIEERSSSNTVDSSGSTLSGYAILWNTESRELFEYGKRFTEIISPNAFDLDDDSDDVKLFFQHDRHMPLARTKGGSLKLYQDQKGIRFEAELPDTSLGNDVRELLKRGILTGEMSFGFSVLQDKWSGSVRTVNKAKLYEISVVVDAAYPQTHSQLRGVMADINKKRIDNIRRRIK